ncbi:hypothetical protein ABZX92_39950 [Lentzea sp. NPDC006480]|uniref:hypothetical protein n=1 Tax=Lentzea sp. NPDC006480 TaxID=3157176 RepID=UPI0033A2172B
MRSSIGQSAGHAVINSISAEATTVKLNALAEAHANAVVDAGLRPWESLTPVLSPASAWGDASPAAGPIVTDAAHLATQRHCVVAAVPRLIKPRR